MNNAERRAYAKQQQDAIWNSTIWWAGLAVAVLAVPSIAIVFASVMPFRSDVGECIIFVLMCWSCTYLGMHLMKYYGLELVISESDAPTPVTYEDYQELSGCQTISPKPVPNSKKPITDRRQGIDRRQGDRRNPMVGAMIYSQSLEAAKRQFN